MQYDGPIRWMAPFSRAVRLFAAFALIAVLVAACGGDDDDDGDSNTSQQTDLVEGAPPSPGAGVGNPEQAEELTLTIEGGKFGEDSISAQVDELTVIHVENKDGTAYRVRFGDIIAGEEIPASATTDVSFTAPNTAEVEGELLSAESDTPLDTVQFEVQGPTGDAE